MRPRPVGKPAAQRPGHTSCELDQLACGGPHLDAVDVRPLYVPRDREELEPRPVVDALGVPPIGAAVEDHGTWAKVSTEFMSVGLPRRPYTPGMAACCAARRGVPPCTRAEPTPLPGCSPRRDEDVDLQVAAVEDAEPAQPLDLLRATSSSGVLVADEHPALVGLGHRHADQHPLEHQVRLLGHDLAVLEGAGLRLIGVADGVLRPRLLVG